LREKKETNEPVVPPPSGYIPFRRRQRSDRLDPTLDPDDYDWDPLVLMNGDPGAPPISMPEYYSVIQPAKIRKWPIELRRAFGRFLYSRFENATYGLKWEFVRSRYNEIEKLRNSTAQGANWSDSDIVAAVNQARGSNNQVQFRPDWLEKNPTNDDGKSTTPQDRYAANNDTAKRITDAIIRRTGQ